MLLNSNKSFNRKIYMYDVFVIKLQATHHSLDFVYYIYIYIYFTLVTRPPSPEVFQNRK